ncbi:MAG: DUF349 domain-containing protein [Cytophagales bacterium]
METNYIAAEHPFGYIKEGKVYLASFLNFPDREVGIVKDSDLAAIKYFENRFNTFTKKVDDLFAAIETAENKGSYLQKLLHLKQLCGSFEAIGDFATIFQKLIDKEVELDELIVKNRLKNLGLKQALLQELDLIKDSSDWINVAEQIKEIKKKWIRIGGVEKSAEEEVEELLKVRLDTFFKRRQEFYEARNQMNEVKLQKYNVLAQKSAEVCNWGDMRKAGEEFRKIKEDWRKVGLVPKKDLDPIMKMYKDSSAILTARVKEYKKNRGPRTQPPHIVAILLPYKKLIERTEQILLELPYGGDDESRKMYDEWKQLGIQRTISDFREMDTQFKVNVARILDIYFMNKIAYKRTPNITRLPLKEQIRIKIGIMKELVQRDKDNIENFENNFAAQNVNAGGNSFDKVFGSKLNSQKRNLDSKQRLLTELEAQHEEIG